MLHCSLHKAGTQAGRAATRGPQPPHLVHVLEHKGAPPLPHMLHCRRLALCCPLHALLSTQPLPPCTAGQQAGKPGPAGRLGAPNRVLKCAATCLHAIQTRSLLQQGSPAHPPVARLSTSGHQSCSSPCVELLAASTWRAPPAGSVLLELLPIALLSCSTPRLLLLLLFSVASSLLPAT